MCSWDKLPREVILQILIHLKDDHRTLEQCQLVCRSWRDPAQKQIYKVVKLQHAQQAEMFIKSMSDPANHASKFVRLLSLGYSLCDSPSIEFIFPRLFDLCPSITRLEAPPGQSSSFWAKLLLEHSKGNVNHLREIPLTDLSCDDNIKLYGYAAYLLRNHLSSLTMCDWPSKNPSFHNDIVAQQLKDFRQLKQINIHLRGDKSIYEVFSFIQTCPTLKSVDVSMTDINRKIHNYVQENDDDPNWYDIKPSTSPSRIERLNIEYIPITTKIMQYILRFFPNLHEFYFKSDHPNWEEDMELLSRIQTEGLRITTDAWLEFLLHLYHQVPKFDISNLFVNNIPDVLENLFKRTDYGETMKIMYLERDTFFDLQPYIGIDHASASKKFIRGYKFYESRTIEVVYASEEDHYEDLPHLAVLERVGYNLKGLQIEIQKADRFADSDTDLYNMACGYFVDHVFRCCPLLNTLSLTQCYLLHCDKNVFPAESLQVLRLDECVVDTMFIEELSKRLPQLSSLVLLECEFAEPEESSDLGDGLLFIYMPDTEFGTLAFIKHDLPDIISIRLSVQTTDEKFFFMINDFNTITPSTADIFGDESTRKRGEQVMAISCRDIKTLALEINAILDVVIHFEGSTYQISTEKCSAYIDDRTELH